ELAAREGLAVPPDLAFRAGMGLGEALSRFAFTLRLLARPDAVRRVASEICDDAARDGVTALEVRFAPQLHGGPGRESFVDAVADVVRERGVTIEACPTSNLHTGAIASIAQHPLPRWLDLGVRATVCTDNTLLSATSSREEHRRARAIPGMTDAKLRAAIANG